MKTLTDIEKLSIALDATNLLGPEAIGHLLSIDFTEEIIRESMARAVLAMNPPRKHSIHQYVVGFVFDQAFEHVALVWKNRPKWQVGKLNGPGGKVEAGESPHDAVTREVLEETSLAIPHWAYVGERYRDPIENDEGYALHIFTAVLPLEELKLAKSLTDEEVQVLPLNLEIVRRKGVPDLAMLIAASEQAMKNSFAIKIEDLPGWFMEDTWLNKD